MCNYCVYAQIVSDQIDLFGMLASPVCAHGVFPHVPPGAIVGITRARPPRWDLASNPTVWKRRLIKRKKVVISAGDPNICDLHHVCHFPLRPCRSHRGRESPILSVPVRHGILAGLAHQGQRRRQGSRTSSLTIAAGQWLVHADHTARRLPDVGKRDLSGRPMGSRGMHASRLLDEAFWAALYMTGCDVLTRSHQAGYRG